MSRAAALFAFALMLIVAAFLWIRTDLLSGHAVAVFFKILIVTAAIAAAVGFYVSRITRLWSSTADRMASFVAALPGTEVLLPEGGPTELRVLAKAMRLMAVRVRQLVDNANIELSRREAILACMAEGVLAVDANLRVIFCNDAFARAFSTRRPVAEGKPLLEVVREPLLREILEEVVREGTAHTQRIQLPSAERRWFEARTLPLGDRPIKGGVIVLHDITDIERQEQVRKDFVADVSHELRTPLTAIRGFAETLLDGALEDKENNRRFIEIILAHAIRLNNIASDLLVISELDRQTQPQASPERIPVLEMIESAIHTVESSAALRQIAISQDVNPQCAVLGYRFRLEQALVNLLDNAVKFNRPKGEVHVFCQTGAGGRVQIVVSDTGIGIPHDELKNIFERFYRVDKSRSRPTGGTGLGLPIVKEVVHSMGGTVSVESQLGRGSKFTITLDAA